ncbi:MAG: ABC transporter permease [Myxococcaceae bacterium]|nr:ABC transporter permease [Myxococcaceae bacterium]
MPDSSPSSSLVELTRMRVLMFVRDPGAVFWVFGFPLVLAFVLGLAFRNRPPDPMHVVVADDPALAAQLKADVTLAVDEAPLDDARWKLRRAQADVLVYRSGGTVTYRYDETRPEGRVARLAVERALERANGRADTLSSADEKVSEPGSRYIDFLVPGLIGMNLMGSSLWGIAYSLVDARKKKLLKRLAATPMKRSDFLLSILLSRLVFLGFELVALVAIGWLAFGVAVQGSLAAVAVLSLLGGLGFAGIAMLIGARTASTETAGGLMNLVMMPMYLLSGAFFSSKHFPDVLQPFIKALPLTALNDSLRAVINEGASLGSQRVPIAIMAAWGLVPFVIALRTFRWQ